MNHIQAAIAFLREDGAAVDRARAFDGQRTIQVNGVFTSRSKIADWLEHMANTEVVEVKMGAAEVADLREAFVATHGGPVELKTGHVPAEVANKQMEAYAAWFPGVPQVRMAPDSLKSDAALENLNQLREVLGLDAGESIMDAVTDLVSGMQKEKLQERLDRAYRERNAVVIAYALMALKAGHAAGWGKDDNPDWDDDWRTVVYVEAAPGKQISWHMPPDMVTCAQGVLPEYHGKWDGTFLSRDPLQMLIEITDDVITSAGWMGAAEAVAGCDDDSLRQNAFDAEMVGLNYGEEETADAKVWFDSGWKAAKGK